MESIHEAGHVRISKRFIKKIDKIPLKLEGTLQNDSTRNIVAIN
jgi:hypothetical protein